MSKWTKRFIGIGVFLALGLVLALVMSMTGSAKPALAQTEPTPSVEIPFLTEWMESPHNDVESDAFVHWDESENKTVEVACAQCHSTPGYVDFLGDGKVDKAPAIGTTVQCAACHSQAATSLSSVQFLSTEEGEDGEPANVVISGLGPEARCMVCHQGRATKTQVDARIAAVKATDPDAVPAPVKDAQGNDVRLGFVNIHYYAAAATLYGSEVHGGYEYDGKAYDAKFDHVTGVDTCVDCHNPHTTEVKVELCQECHNGVNTVADLRKVREPSSASDYDGDGNVKEGMADEITGLQTMLYGAMQAYAKDVLQSGIVYDVAAYPYFFEDKDGDGKTDKNAEGGNVGFTSWTPRLLKAAYNYQVSLKDPGAYAHGNKYIVQLLHDSIEDLNAKLATKLDLSKVEREDPGHFAGESEAFRHWDGEGGVVPASCAKCHSATGLPQFIKEGAVISNPASTGFQCSTCHNSAEFPAVYEVASVPFPSGKSVTFGTEEAPVVGANLCLECHQGRESTVSVNRAIGDTEADTINEKLAFRNVHYFAAGATLFGNETMGMYQYEGKEYAGRFVHDGKSFQTCTDCHDKHELAVDTTACQACHKTTDPEAIRLSADDFDGDGDVAEGLKYEQVAYQSMLYKAIQAYAKDVVKVGIIYNPSAHPYFFQDKNNDRIIDKDEKGANIRYTSFTPRLLKAAYNYQYAQKDPGAYVHNGKYVLQALYDSIEDLNTQLPTKLDMSKMVRPE
jgi:hypothetical protein